VSLRKSRKGYAAGKSTRAVSRSASSSAPFYPLFSIGCRLPLGSITAAADLRKRYGNTRPRFDSSRSEDSGHARMPRERALCELAQILPEGLPLVLALPHVSPQGPPHTRGGRGPRVEQPWHRAGDHRAPRFDNLRLQRRSPRAACQAKRVQSSRDGAPRYFPCSSNVDRAFPRPGGST
jgi:hypothetical protein